MDFNNLRKKFINSIKPNKHSNRFTPLNNMFCYGRTGSVLHIHLVPNDLHNMKASLGDEQFNRLIETKLEDFLGKLQPVVKNDDTISSVFAVSPIFFHENWRKAHEKLGFDPVKEIILGENDGMPDEQKLKFLNMFKNKRVFYTNLKREKFLTMEYNQIRNEKTNERTNERTF